MTQLCSFESSQGLGTKQQGDNTLVRGFKTPPGQTTLLKLGTKQQQQHTPLSQRKRQPRRLYARDNNTERTLTHTSYRGSK